ncbi:MAG: ABC transporter ATP-binding protein [Actinobacteria bacterium]|nr:ABC transporter ATP-binding protein [Actinomycetota bacterium]
MERHILKTNGLKKIYMMGKVETPALSGVDITVKKGEFVALMGPSGSGKTTFLNLTGMLDNPTDGKIHIDGFDISALKESKKSLFRLEKLGFIFQFFNLFPELTALENVYLPMMLKGIKKKDYISRAEELLDLVGLKKRMRHYPAELSGGEQQRVTIARALSNSPALILADEPTANLDSTTAAEIMELFREINKQGETIFMVTHEKEFGEKADRIIKLKDGLVVN